MAKVCYDLILLVFYLVVKNSVVVQAKAFALLTIQGEALASNGCSKLHPQA
jgi:hypothetical protein